MYCQNCGKELVNGSVKCSECGAEINCVYSHPEQDSLSGGLAAVGFFFPFIGVISYIVGKLKYHQYPLRTKSLGKGIVFGYIFRFLISIVVVLVYYFLMKNYTQQLMIL